MKTLFLITARGGSKGIPGKNIKTFYGKPLINYSINLARQFVGDDAICVSTDSEEIIKVVEGNGIKVPFVRPGELATDTASSNAVIMHALNFYKDQGRYFDNVVLLQPTSPLRLKKHVAEAIALYNTNLDAVVSVVKSKTNPYSNLFLADRNGFLVKMAEWKEVSRRQDAPVTYEINGAVYVFNVNSLWERKISEFEKRALFIMPSVHSVDIDEPSDWIWAEYLLEKKFVNLDYE